MIPLDCGDRTFMLLCAALAFRAAPGPAFFSGGRTRSKNAVNSAGADGLLHGNPALLGMQALAVLTRSIVSGVVTRLLSTVLDKTRAIGSIDEYQHEGPDLVEHGEKTYHGSITHSFIPQLHTT